MEIFLPARKFMKGLLAARKVDRIDVRSPGRAEGDRN